MNFLNLFNNLVPGGIEVESSSSPVSEDLSDVYFKEEAKSKAKNKQNPKYVKPKCDFDLFEELKRINDEVDPQLNNLIFNNGDYTPVEEEIYIDEGDEELSSVEDDIELNELDLTDIIPAQELEYEKELQPEDIDDLPELTPEQEEELIKSQSDVWELSSKEGNNIEIKKVDTKTNLEKDFEDADEPLDDYIYETDGEKIKACLSGYKDYLINEDGSIDTLSSIKVTSSCVDKQGHFKIKFNTIHGDFDCREVGMLESLQGSPVKVMGSFNCSDNECLSSLIGSPKIVNKDYICNNNINLESKKYMTKNIGGKSYFEKCYSLKD